MWCRFRSWSCFGSLLSEARPGAFAWLIALSAWFGAAAQAAVPLVTLGPDASGVGRVVTELGGGSATTLFALGDGSSSFNGLSFRPADGRYYAIANDSAFSSSLVSFDGSGAGSLTTLGALGAGVVGMAYRSSEDRFYAASTSTTGVSTLLRVTTGGVVATVGTLGSGFLGGLAFGDTPEALFGIAADAFGVQRVLYRIDVATASATELFALGDGSLSFAGGLSWDAGGSRFEVIGSDAFGESSLYRFDLGGATSLSFAGAVGPGFVNASLTSPVPEPGTLTLLLGGLLCAVAQAAWIRHRRLLMHRLRSLPLALFAFLTVLASSAQAQFSNPTRNVENPDRFPYQESGSATINPNVYNDFIFFPTPFGKRVVIEYVSVNCFTASGASSFPQVLLATTRIVGPNATAGAQANAVPVQFRGAAPFGGFVYAGSAPVKMYSDYVPFDPTGGSGIYLNIFRTDTSVSATCTGVVTGHLFTP